MPVITRYRKVGDKLVGSQENVSVMNMTAEEYKNYLLTAPVEEVKKLDEQPIPQGTVPTGTWRNGQWVAYAPGEIQKPQ